MDDQTERLEVAKKIRHIKLEGDVATRLNNDDVWEDRACAILSRRDELMKKRGAVEGIDELLGGKIKSGMYSDEEILQMFLKEAREIKSRKEREIAALLREREKEEKYNGKSCEKCFGRAGFLC